MSDGAQAAAGPSRRSRGFAAAAALLAASAVISRLLGLVRERVIAHQLGASAGADAYGAAFLIPDILNYFLAGGALSIAFIPLYSSVRERSGDARAAALFENVLGATAAAVVAATALMWWRAPQLVAWFFGDFAPDTAALTVRLVRILLPAQIFFVVGGIVRAVLMARQRFGSQALAPLVYNLGIIAAGGWFGARFGAEAFAWGALAGAAVGPFCIPAVQIWRDAALRPRLRLSLRDPQLLAYAGMAAPIMLGVSLLTVDEWYDKYFGAKLAEGSLAYLRYARLLAQVPIGVIGQAIATAALPTLSALWAERRRDELDRTLLDTLRSGLGLGLLCAAGLYAFAHPIVVLIMQTGRFVASDSAQVTVLLRWFALAVPAWIVQQIAVRAFYARGQMWFPMGLGTGIAVAFFPLYALLGATVEGLAMAGVIGMSTSALATLSCARARHGGPRLAPLLSTLWRAGAIAAVSGAAGAWAGARVPGAFATLAVGGAVFGALAAPGAYWLGDAPLRQTVERVLRRVRRVR